MTLRTKAIQAAVLAATMCAAATAFAATHIFINPDIQTSTIYDRAFADVAAEPASQVTFTVYAVGAPAQASVPMNALNFAVSPDLFGMSRGADLKRGCW